MTSDIPECADVIEDKGVTFKKGDVEDLKKTLEMLCNDPTTVEKFKAEAADFVCSKYNWDDVTQKTLELYKKIIN